MAFDESYRRQVALLLRAIPFIAEENSFALKGGTAINLFVRDLPRLSVDIDLTYLPLLPRARALGAIDKAMRRIAARVQKGIRGSRIAHGMIEDAVNKLFVREAGVQIKMEVTPVMRGCAFDAELRTVSPAVEAAFGFAEMKVLSFPDLYAGRSSPPSIASILGTCSTSAICSPTRASTIGCAPPSSSICSATTGPWPRCWPCVPRISRPSSSRVSRV